MAFTRFFKNSAAAVRAFHLGNVKLNENISVVHERIDNVLLIGINRPASRNAIDLETAQRLSDTLASFETDPMLKIAVLYGKGGNFSSGMDLKKIADHSTTLDHLRTNRLLHLPNKCFAKPVIAAINGYAVSEGLELALLCDLRIVEENATLGFFNRRFGIPITNGGTSRLPKLIGVSRALDMLLTGRKVDGKLAHEWGLANRVCQIGTSLGQAVNLARALCTMEQSSLLADRQALYNASFASHCQDVQFELQNASNSFSNNAGAGAKLFADGFGRRGSFKKQLN